MLITSYTSRDYQKACRIVMQCADLTNQYIDQHKPWVLAKDPNKKDEVQAICTTGIEAFRLLCVYLKPILPALITQAEAFLNCEALDFALCDTRLGKHTLNSFQPLMQRIQSEQITTMLEESESSCQH